MSKYTKMVFSCHCHHHRWAEGSIYVEECLLLLNNLNNIEAHNVSHVLAIKKCTHVDKWDIFYEIDTHCFPQALPIDHWLSESDDSIDTSHHKIYDYSLCMVVLDFRCV